MARKESKSTERGEGRKAREKTREIGRGLRKKKEKKEQGGVR